MGRAEATGYRVRTPRVGPELGLASFGRDSSIAIQREVKESLLSARNARASPSAALGTIEKPFRKHG